MKPLLSTSLHSPGQPNNPQHSYKSTTVGVHVTKTLEIHLKHKKEQKSGYAVIVMMSNYNGEQFPVVRAGFIVIKY